MSRHTCVFCCLISNCVVELVVTIILKKHFASVFMVYFNSDGLKSQICPIILKLVPQK